MAMVTRDLPCDVVIKQQFNFLVILVIRTIRHLVDLFYVSEYCATLPRAFNCHVDEY